MPRAIDFRNITPDYDPNRSGTEFHLTRYSDGAAEVIANAVQEFIENIKQQVLDLILEAGGGIDIDELIENLGKIFLSITSPINALNLFNVIPRYLMGFIPFSNIGDGYANLLANPTFQGAESVQGSDAWLWDDVEGHTKPGCTRTVAQGIRRHLLSNAIPCSPGQEFDMSVWCKWSGLAYTGTPIKIQVLRLLEFEHIAVDDLVVPPAPPATQGWTKLGAMYTVPDGTDMVCLQLAVTDQATAGSVWFDDGDVHKTGLLQIPWIENLPDALGELWDGLQQAVDDILELFGVNEDVRAYIQQLFDAIDAVWVEIGKVWDDLLKAVEDILALFGLTGDLATDIQNVIDMIFKTLTQASDAVGKTLEEMAEALKRIPNIFVGGVGGPPNIGDSLAATWDLLMSGLVGVQGGSGASLADLFNIGFDISSWSSKGRMSFDILGIRDNKPLDQGLLPTSVSNFGLSQVSSQVSAPTFQVTRRSSAMAFIRCEESNQKGCVQWLGVGNASISSCACRVWKMNVTNGDLTMVQTQTIPLANLPTSSVGWITCDFPPLDVVAGEVYGIEICVNGGADAYHHDVVGTTTWMPPNTRVFPRAMAATRDSTTNNTVGTVIPGASVVYSQKTPWIEWGIYSTPVPGYNPPQTHLFNTPRTGTIPIPAWANFVDVVALGAGAGGGGGGFAGIAQQNGGGAGQWGTATWVRGTHFTTDVIDATVRAGGNGAGTGGTPTRGGDSSARLTVNGATVTGAGGATAWGQDNGQGAGHIGWNGTIYQGGGQQGANGGAGSVPGGGGASGPDLIGGNGGNGASGALWITFRQN